MKKVIFLVILSLLFLSCHHLDHMTKEEKEKYNRSMQQWYYRYNAGQTP